MFGVWPSPKFTRPDLYFPSTILQQCTAVEKSSMLSERCFEGGVFEMLVLPYIVDVSVVNTRSIRYHTSVSLPYLSLILSQQCRCGQGMLKLLEWNNPRWKRFGAKRDCPYFPMRTGGRWERPGRFQITRSLTDRRTKKRYTECGTRL